MTTRYIQRDVFQVAVFLLSLCIPVFNGLAQPVQMPDHAGLDLVNGQKLRLADFRGKILFVDFWASWCPPCLLSLPAYERMYASLDREHFGLVAINVDEHTADGVEFLEEHPVSYPVLADPKGVLGIPLGVRSLPMSFLVDREGNITEVFNSFREGDEILIRAKIAALMNAKR